MRDVVPRWEWRTFASDLGAAEAAWAALPVEGVESSDAIYLLDRGARASVKVRGGRLDVKELVGTDRRGLQQWCPTMQAAFPLSAADVRRALGALGVEAPPLGRPAYELGQLLGEVLPAVGTLRAVAVRKRRARHVVDGCPAETTEFTVEGRRGRTVAVESEDPARLLAVLRRLGVEGLENVPYPLGLARLVGLVGGSPGSERHAVLDVGTSSVKLHVGERRADGPWRTVVDRSEVTRLGEGLERTGAIQPAALERTLVAVEGMVGEAHRLGVRSVVAVGTMGLRTASNRAEVVARLKERCGVEVEVVSGEEEGRLAYLAVQSGLGLPAGTLAVFDTGGGSTQLTFGRGPVVEERFSLDVGAVRFTEAFGLGGAVPAETLRRAREAVAAGLARLDGRPRPDALVGMGGAVTNLAAVALGLALYDADAVQGSTLEAREVDRQIEVYRSLSAEERRRVVGLQPDRAEVILAGALIVRTVMAKLGRDALTVSDRGLRHGVLVDRFPAGRTA